jgi:mutator protein MutT
VRFVLRSLDAVREAAVTAFGVPPFDARAYVEALLAEPACRLATEVEGSWPPGETSRRRTRRPSARETSSALIVRDGKVLLERRSPAAHSHPGAWDTPGGHVAPGESAVECLARELAEELGIEAPHPRLVAVQEEESVAVGGAYLHHVHLVESFGGEPAPREGQTLRWWDLRALAGPEAPAELNPLIAWIVREGMFRRWLPPEADRSRAGARR